MSLIHPLSYVQWRSEYLSECQTCSLFKYSIAAWLSNTLGFACGMNFKQFCSLFRIILWPLSQVTIWKPNFLFGIHMIIIIPKKSLDFEWLDNLDTKVLFGIQMYPDPHYKCRIAKTEIVLIQKLRTEWMDELNAANKQCIMQVPNQFKIC